jgi:hypothetical protein
MVVTSPPQVTFNGVVGKTTGRSHVEDFFLFLVDSVHIVFHGGFVFYMVNSDAQQASGLHLLGEKCGADDSSQ